MRFHLGARIDALRPFREAKLKGRIARSTRRWLRRELLGKASRKIKK
ncbi:MAG: hypothetical protein AB1485_04065 [Candidatus Thermoplasmatota archaeon]